MSTSLTSAQSSRTDTNIQDFLLTTSSYFSRRTRQRGRDTVADSCHPKHTSPDVTTTLTQYTTISPTSVQWTESFSQVIVGFWEIRGVGEADNTSLFNSSSCIYKKKVWSLSSKKTRQAVACHHDTMARDRMTAATSPRTRSFACCLRATGGTLPLQIRLYGEVTRRQLAQGEVKNRMCGVDNTKIFGSRNG